MERACKSTAVGCLLPPLLALAGDQQLGSLSLTNTLLESLSPLEKLVAEVRTSVHHDLTTRIASNNNR